MNDSDVDLGGLLWRERRRLVREERVAEPINVSSLGLVGNLLASPLPLERCLDVFVLAIGRERRRGRGVQGRVGAVAGQGGGDGRRILQRRIRVRPDILNMIASGAAGGRIVIPSPLSCRLLCVRVASGSGGGDSRVAVGEFAAGIGLGLGGVVDDDDLLGQAVAVEIVPVGLVGAPAFPRRLGRAGGTGHCGRVAVVVTGSRRVEAVQEVVVVVRLLAVRRRTGR